MRLINNQTFSGQNEATENLRKFVEVLSGTLLKLSFIAKTFVSKVRVAYVCLYIVINSLMKNWERFF